MSTVRRRGDTIRAHDVRATTGSPHLLGPLALYSGQPRAAFELLAPAEPVVEGGVHRHVQVGGDRVLAGHQHGLAILGGGDEDAGDDLFLGAVLVGPVLAHDGCHLRHVVGRQPVDDGAVALAEEYGVTRGLIYNVKNRNCWTHV